MEDKGGGVVNSGERVEILWVVVRKDDLEASSDSIPQGIRKASFEASTLFAQGKTILANQEGRHGMVLTIIAAEVIYVSNTFSSYPGDEHVEISNCELPFTVGRRIELLDCLLKVGVALGDILVLGK